MFKMKMNRKYDNQFMDPYFDALVDENLEQVDGITDELIYETELYADELMVADGREPLYVISLDDYRGSVPMVHQQRVFELKQTMFLMKMFYLELAFTLLAAAAAYYLQRNVAPAVLISGLVLTIVSAFLTSLFLTKPTTE